VHDGLCANPILSGGVSCSIISIASGLTEAPTERHPTGHGYASYLLESAQARGDRPPERPAGVTTKQPGGVRRPHLPLVDLRGRIERAGKSRAATAWRSTRLPAPGRQLTQGWQVKAANLRSLVDEARSLLQTFGRCDLVKVRATRSSGARSLAEPVDHEPRVRSQRGSALLFRNRTFCRMNSTFSCGKMSNDEQVFW